ncbi:hypothetical protein S7711_02293 [Stachybotrys chartarum IBT 7711]|uniref:Enoyl reductase (ER) domain-containing protein n=1 Tax=Stachybotrys chartarum (strain CBS 109288 / IBT 7711) TaxID=1280523 RepID=A0A084B0V1_STACB|nr:hypothetical protein S7711_02293 [Stachybotrys chartarum IBT 7711]
MQALVLHPATASVSLRDWPKPLPAPGEVLEHRVIGTDFAGVVVGASAGLHGLTDVRTKNGTRVAGFAQGGGCSSREDDLPGAFAEYVALPYDLLWTVPDDMSFEAAATVSMCSMTAAQAVFTRFGLPSPFFPSNWHDKKLHEDDGTVNVFVYGASTSLGLYIAQLVRLSFATSRRKLRLLGAASPSKHEFLRQSPYSYDVLVDYRDPAWADSVRDATKGKGIAYALDAISEGETVSKTHSTLAEDAHFAVFRGPVGGRYDPDKMRIKPSPQISSNPNPGVGTAFPSDPEARRFATSFYDYLSSTLQHGQWPLQPNPVRLMPGGLERVVPDGFALLGNGPVSARPALQREEVYMRPISGEKLVYRI